MWHVGDVEIRKFHVCMAGFWRPVTFMSPTAFCVGTVGPLRLYEPMRPGWLGSGVAGSLFVAFLW